MQTIPGPGGALVKVDEFTAGYVECALWSSTDDAGKPLECRNKDLTREAFIRMLEDCRAFQVACADDLGTFSPDQCGHLFWLTRAGHGDGFWAWEGELRARGERLTKVAQCFGDDALIAGEDGTIDCCGGPAGVVARHGSYVVVDDFTAGYVRAAMRMFRGGYGDLADAGRAGPESLGDAALAQMVQDCRRFTEDNQAELDTVPKSEAGAALWRLRADPDMHGEDWGVEDPAVRTRLNKRAAAMGPTGLAVGEDGKLEIAVPERDAGRTFQRALKTLEQTPWSEGTDAEGPRWVRKVRVGEVGAYHLYAAGEVGCRVFAAPDEQGLPALWLGQEARQVERPSMRIRTGRSKGVER